MADRLLVELSSDRRVSVGQWLDGDLLPDIGGSSDLAWPLGDDALEDLRWYLEDYLRAPFGVYGERGPEVEARLTAWGEAVFSAIFGRGKARDTYIRMRARPGPLEMVFRSESPALLGLPWELMRDAGRPAPLALDLALSRSLPIAESAETIPVPEGRLRVLMVISRPAGTGDVGYRMIARPLLDRLEAVHGQVDLMVLRPPTLDALHEVLTSAASAGQPFQVVHFDGHGALTSRRPTGGGAPWAFEGDTMTEGVLVFEKPGGGPDEVPASRVAQVLKAARVPVVVLNACQSGAVGKDLEAAVATRLLKEGTASVVAMAYTVYAVAAAEFMAAFYERLFGGGTVTAAVTAGRQRLFQRNLRPSPKGDMPLADWVVPVHYLRREVSFPQARAPRPAAELSLDAALDELRKPTAPESGTGSLDPVGSFVGRDALFFDLEAAARLQRVVLLHGPGGTGKTELAKAFGRWWRDTGGVEDPRLVFVHSFEPGVASFGLDGVITEVGLGVFGSDFAALDTVERRQVVLNLLAEHRLLLLWDNFETVASMPDPAQATPPLDEAGRQDLSDFLHRVAAKGRSAVIITSRTTEDWLGDVRRITVSGLVPHEAAEYAGDLLAPYPAAQQRRAGRPFGDLMEWLDGHPLSMRLTLPHLETTEPGELLDALRGITPLPGPLTTTGGRTTSLPASISYSYSHLAAGARRLLAAVSLFQGVTNALVLAAFAVSPRLPERFQGASRDEWVDALEAASGVGLLTPLGAGLYQLHPALPAYLTAQWRAEESDGYAAVRDAATGALAEAYGAFGNWASDQVASGDAKLAVDMIGLQRRTMGNLLGYALDQHRWEEAAGISQALDAYWRVRGLSAEADLWADRIRLATENPDGSAPMFDSAAGELWLIVTNAQAARQLESRRMDEAERSYRQILASLQVQPETPSQQQRFAATCHHLGTIAQRKGRLEEAEDWYRKALVIEEAIDYRPGLAGTYYQLGWLAQDRGRFEEAEEWYTKSLGINTELGDHPHMADAYHQLGWVAQDRGRFDEAEEWYAKSLAIKEHISDRYGTALTYHQLGNVAYLRGRLERAEEWYTRALVIREDIDDQPGMASSYHQLGMVAQRRRHLDDAERWYVKALAIKEALRDWVSVIRTHGQLGLLAEQRGESARALEWMIRCVAMFPEFPHPVTDPAPEHLARLTAKLGMGVLAATWQEVTGDPLPQVVRDYAAARQESRHEADG